MSFPCIPRCNHQDIDIFYTTFPAIQYQPVLKQENHDRLRMEIPDKATFLHIDTEWTQSL